ncbi:hypothetical protein [Amycolatopsis sp. RTGN1]|uniref:hypothetical protein n=1 Tax=Amycolatopsis ponsaeliensis TaxID=2992142 RepID=UPI002550940B|nr:hypothetical protein [Amycolatopsis sp. RTGN1]
MTEPAVSFVDMAGLLDGVLAGLFGVAAQIAPPVLVDPVLGSVETRLSGLWPSPRDDGDGSPARLMAPRGLRGVLIGAAASSQTMGKLSLLGLPMDSLQEAWAPDGSTIGGISVQVIDDDSADPGGPLAVEASTLSLTVSAVDALWRLDPLAAGDDGAALAGAYADLMTAALAGQSGTAEFQAASAGQALADTLQEGRRYLADTAARWMTAVLGLVRLRAAQQADPALPAAGAQVQALVDAYNQTPVPSGTPLLTYLAQIFLGNHPATRNLPDAGQSVDGGHFTDVLRSAIRHTDAGSPIDEDGGSDHAPDGGPDPGDLGNAIVASALALADQVRTYTQDPAGRWDDDKADCSSFVQRALFNAGIAQFDPGPAHENVWSTKNYAERNDVFETVKWARARPGDVLVQGGYEDVAGTPTWKAHTGIFRRPSATKPDLLEGISMDSKGPARAGLWGADPPRGYYRFGANLLVRRLKRDVLGAAGPVVPAASPVEGGVRIRIDTRGMAAATRVLVGPDQAAGVLGNAEGSLTYATLPPGQPGACAVVVSDAAEHTRTFPQAVEYVQDPERAARAVVAGYEVIISELIDTATALIAAGTLDDAARQQLTGTLEQRLNATDEGWFARLDDALGGTPTAAVDAIFEFASTQLIQLTDRFWSVLAT